jgi:excisionase family DNA binding protein
MVADSGRSLVSIEEAAEIVGVSRRTIYNWLADRKIEAVRTAGGAIRVYEDTLFKAFDASEIVSNATGRKKSWK